jgi:hypothetical protein
MKEIHQVHITILVFRFRKVKFIYPLFVLHSFTGQKSPTKAKNACELAFIIVFCTNTSRYYFFKKNLFSLLLLDKQKYIHCVAHRGFAIHFIFYLLIFI